MAFFTINIPDAYGAPTEAVINSDQVSFVEIIGARTDVGSAGIHVRGTIYTPSDMSYDEVTTKLGATALNA